MCKHVAAVLYGIGARLDEQPELLFALRKVDQQDLIARAGKGLRADQKGPKAGKVLDTGDLSEMFGIEMAPDAEAASQRRFARSNGVTNVRRVRPPSRRTSRGPSS